MVQPRNRRVASEAYAVDAARILDVKSSQNGPVKNLIPNAGPYAEEPAWLSPSWGTGGSGTRMYAESPNAASGRGYIRNTWTVGATTSNFSFRTPAGKAAPEEFYAGSVTVWSSRATVLGAVLYFYDDAGAQIGSGFNRLYDVPAGVQTLLDVNGFKAPAGTVFVRLSVNANPSRTPLPQANDILDISGAIVSQGSTVAAFFDGDSDGAYWDGPDPENSEAIKSLPPLFAAPYTNAPAAAGTHEGDYSTGHRLYLPPGADIEPLRRRIKQALDGENTFRLAWLGHSMVAGQGGTPGIVDNVRLLQQRAAQAGNAVTGIVTAVNNTTTDTRVAFDPEWESIGAPRTNMQLHRRCLVAGKTFTYASDTPGTTVDIYTFGNGSPVTYSIDGSAPVTITPSGNPAIQVTTVTGKSNTNHTVTVTSTTTAAAYLLGIAVRHSTGLEIGNFGYSGSIAYDWTPDYFSASARFYNGYNGVLTSWKADALIIQLGANELIHGSTPELLATNLNAIIAAARAIGREAVLVLDPPVEDATRTTWFAQYVPAVYGVADEQRVPLVDFTAHWINRAVANAQGFYYDQWHPNVKGYYDLHAVMAEILLP